MKETKLSKVNLDNKHKPSDIMSTSMLGKVSE